MSATTDKPMGQRKPKPGVAGEVPWGPALSGPCEDNKPEYTTPGRAAGTPEQTTAAFDQRVQSGQFAVRTLYADGHHGPDRNNLTGSDPGTPDNQAHEHDDWKRSPPEVIDQDPTSVNVGWFATSRAPDDKKNTLTKPGDKLPTTT